MTKEVMLRSYLIEISLIIWRIISQREDIFNKLHNNDFLGNEKKSRKE